MVFITEGFFEVAIESWPGWDLNPRPLNSVQMLYPTELSGQLCTATPISWFVQCHISFRLLSASVVTFVFNRNFLEVITCIYI